MTKIELSKAAQSIWAKSDYGKGEGWLPLFMHMSDACGTILKLWDEWLPVGTRNIISQPLNNDSALARKLVGFVGAAHDLGKATPVFQAGNYRSGFNNEEADLSRKPERAGLPVAKGLRERRRPNHAIAGALILKKFLKEQRGWTDLDAIKALSAIVGAHHGRMPLEKDMSEGRELKSEMGWSKKDEEKWWLVQCELVDYALQLSNITESDLELLGKYCLSIQAASVLSGLVIMADWIASNQEFFPLLHVNRPISESLVCAHQKADGHDVGLLQKDGLLERIEQAWNEFEILPTWQGDPNIQHASFESFTAKFGLPKGATMRPVQRAAIEISQTVDDLGMLIIEAPMGEGKTEAALASSEILGARFGRGGVCVALPTMATTDAMFGRVHRWLSHLQKQHPEAKQSLYLAHGKAGLNDEFRGLMRTRTAGAKSVESVAIDFVEDTNSGGISARGGRQEMSEGVVVADWFTGRKKGMLSNFVVCTVDQVLMGALQMKHLALRHIALANKVVIIDECHAYDVYMRAYLERALEWLGAWRVPVILLSATLPASQRQSMLEAYHKGVSASLWKKPEPRSPRKRASRWSKSESGETVTSSPDPASTPRFANIKGEVASKVNLDSIASPLKNADVGDSELYAYPLITYATSDDVAEYAPEPSARATNLTLSLMGDDLCELENLLRESLQDGGCAGIICTTIGRAQETSQALRRCFPGDQVKLTHSAFMDLDRMENERELRETLGPQATRANGHRPSKLIVVGTQVLEQSLDIDFDLLVTDIAPVDLLLQRMGRLHRHARSEEDRPTPVRRARCYVRGVEEIKSDGPVFARGVDAVYQPAFLIETLAVTGLAEGIATGSAENQPVRQVELPEDIAPLVQRAYGPEIETLIPEAWASMYEAKIAIRDDNNEEKRRRALGCLLPSAKNQVRNSRSLVDLFSRELDDEDEHRGIQAVRDTQETVEVLIVHRTESGLYLPPWIGDNRAGIPCGAEIPADREPETNLAVLLSRCSVRLPLKMCHPDRIGDLIDEIEKGCSIGAWQHSSWLGGQLVIPMELIRAESQREDRLDELTANVFGWQLRYTRRGGLSADHDRVD